MDANKNTKFPLVVIIGGGFGGIEVAKGLKDAEAEVLLLDRNNYHIFQPLLYQVATGTLEADTVSYPIRKMFAGQKNFDFKIAEVTKVSPETNSIETSLGPIAYDYLVVATGANTNYFGNKEMEANAMPMKSTTEALNLKSKILQSLEEATLKATKEERAPYMTFVFAGAGPTGVELAGAVAEIRNKVLPLEYPTLNKDEFNIYLCDMMPRVLPPLSEKASKKAQEALEAMGVQVLTGVKINTYNGEEMSFEGGRVIKTKNVVWSAGVAGVVPDGIAKESVVRGNRIQVDSIGRAKGYNNIFAVGDVAAEISEKLERGHPMVGAVATQAGKHLGKNLARIIKGQPTEPFKYWDKGSMAVIGKNKAVADIGSFKTAGFFAWLMWMGVHLLLMAGFRNKVVAFVNWFGGYFTYSGGTRLILTKTKKDPIPVPSDLPRP
ncbi:NAD(P)/FAD-dependent oxidoreductase [Mucilaginibacter robiniae]|uniref:NADH:ubiquinone reductase (non-electrogenic) n=1 Tax=Mucilaginibacter robiniae TaxID=2728022 RepID=A0A7L5DTE7_9SPHI|nr:NAD(P)/FAD-dependent oxidoreductase [Mucilaginibacter robiniae]QJD94375.1 NAD(P)/FAD-dependent oxidoreductase [Mucilaginibacter robiniae]